MSLRHDAMRTLDTQLDIINYYKSDLGQMNMVAFIESMVDLENMAHPEGDPQEYAAHTGLRLAHEIVTELNRAPSYYMTEEMMALTFHAAETVPPAKFTRDDAPTPSGFVMLPAPLLIPDVNDKIMTAHAFAWWLTDINVHASDAQVSTPAFMYVLFSYKGDADQDDALGKWKQENPESWMACPPWMVAHWQPLFLGRDWDDGTGTTVAISDGARDTQARHSTGIAFLRTFFLLVRQEIAYAQHERPDRATARRIAGSGFASEYGDVQIVTLRKMRPVGDHDGPGDGEVEWSHRWIVSGHWRNEYHPSCHDCQTLGHHCGEHPNWIEAYEKGPADRPLIIKDRVFVWKR